MSKRKLLSLLSLVLTFGLLAAACGDSDEGDSTATTAGEGTTEETVAETGDGETTTTVELAQATGSVLDAVIARGSLNCGVSGAAVAFSETQADGSQVGFDADYCRVVAAAILGDANAVNFVPLNAQERFTAVRTGAVDLLMRNTTWTQSRDSSIGMDFGPTTYYDGQQFMGRASDGFSTSSQVADLDGLTACTNSGTTTEKNVADAATAAGITINLGGPFEDFDQVTQAFIDGTCDIVTTDGSGLVGRAAVNQPNDWVIFPAAPISKEPLGPTYGQNDSAFADVVNWAVYATIIADENGVTSANALEMAANPPSAEIAGLLGGAEELQSAMGIPADGFLQAILQVGNYDEIYTRNLGPVGLVREGSSNAPWNEGGLIYAPPSR